MMISFAYFYKEIFAEKTRLFLTIFAVAWGTASIAIMLAVGEGLRLTFSQAMTGAGRNIIYVAGGQTSTNYRGQALNQSVTITREDAEMIRCSLPPTVTVTPEFTFSANIRYKKSQDKLMISAVEPVYAKLRNIQAQAGGRFINDIDNKLNAQVVVLGVERTKMFAGVNPLGKTLFIENKPFQVIGVTQPKLQMWSYQTPDSYLMWIPANTYINLANPQFVINLVVVLKNPHDLPLIKRQLIQLIALRHGFDPNDQNLLQFRDSSEAQAKTDQLFSGMEIFLGIIGGFTLLIAGVGIANVMFVTVKRATREIGIRMAVGARDYQIMLHYILQSLITTATGGAIGIGLAKTIVAGISAIPIKSDIAKFVGAPKPVLSGLVLFIVVLTLGLIGFLAGFFPARTASAIHPAEALRYE